MSELKRIVREFGRQVEEAEARTAKTLGEVGAAIKLTDKERRDKLSIALKQVQEGSELIANACVAILKAMDESEGSTDEIVAQVEGMKQMRLRDMGKPQLIAGKDKEVSNG